MKGLGGLGDMSRLMKQAQGQVRDMKKKMQEVDERLAERIVEGSAGGGMVKVLVNGHQEPVDVVIEKSVVEDGDVEFLQEMVLAAVRQGIKKSQEVAEEEKSKVMGGLGGAIPGLENLL